MSTAKNQIHIFYNGVKGNSQLLQVIDTQTQPRILITANDDDTLYTLLMSDPDAPAKDWLHWLVTNIPGAAPDIGQGDEVISYAPPSPPSGVHRYIFTLYKQPASIMVTAPEQRGNFNVEAFEAKHGLKKVASRTVKVPAKN